MAHACSMAAIEAYSYITQLCDIKLAADSCHAQRDL